MVHAALQEMPAAWREPPRASKQLVGGSWGLGGPNPEGLAQDLAALEAELEDPLDDLEEEGTTLSSATKEWWRWPLPLRLRSCEELGVAAEE